MFTGGLTAKEDFRCSLLTPTEVNTLKTGQPFVSFTNPSYSIIQQLHLSWTWHGNNVFKRVYGATADLRYWNHKDCPHSAKQHTSRYKGEVMFALVRLCAL
jgi:hypothetical protein